MLYGCDASVDRFKIARDDLIERVDGIITVGEFYEMAAGGHHLHLIARLVRRQRECAELSSTRSHQSIRTVDHLGPCFGFGSSAMLGACEPLVVEVGCPCAKPALPLAARNEHGKRLPSERWWRSTDEPE